ncbi:hypothetical protein DQR70_05925 [Salmonella enterica subsp. enterica serovar Oslo]|nr:hypothetical protein [Salmonella enterica subsp. enterica serovar Oslo]
MSVVDKLVHEIKRAIPKPVLEVAFLKRMGRNHKYAGGLDWEIRKHVITDQIVEDLDILGAETVNIPLSGAEVQFLENQDYRTVIRIPKSKTKGRRISQVIAFNYWYNTVAADLNNGWQTGGGNIQNCGNSPLMQTAQQVIRAAGPAPINSSASVELIAENTVVINDYMGKVQQGSLTCRLGQDDELSSFNGPAVFQLAQLAVFAAKAWIYNNTVIDLDSGYLYGGAELSKIESIIEGYSDAYDNYTDFLRDEVMAVNRMNDKAAHSTYLRGLIAGQAR